MDYFSFDLQLFAGNAVNVTLPATAGTTDVARYYANVWNGSALELQWLTAAQFAEVTTDGTTAATADAIVAKLLNNRLDVKVSTDTSTAAEDLDTVTVTGTAAVPNTGIKVSVAASFETDGEATPNYTPAGAATAKKATVVFAGDYAGLVSTMTSDTNTSVNTGATTAKLTAATELLPVQLVVSANAKVDTMKAETGDATFQLVTGDEGEEISLVSGKVTVDAGATFVVGGNEYKNASNGGTGEPPTATEAVITASNDGSISFAGVTAPGVVAFKSGDATFTTNNTDGNSNVTIKAGEVTSVDTGVTCTVTVDANVAAEAAKTVKIDGTSYTNAVEAVASLTWDGTDVKLETGTVTVSETDVAIKIGTEDTVTNNADFAITVASTGTVTGLADGSAFTYKDNTVTRKYATAGDLDELDAGTILLSGTGLATITVDADGKIDNSATNAVYNVALKKADTAVNVEGTSYTTASAEATTLAVTVATEGTTVTLAEDSGAVSLLKDGVITAGGNVVTYTTAANEVTDTITVSADGSVKANNLGSAFTVAQGNDVITYKTLVTGSAPTPSTVGANTLAIVAGDAAGLANAVVSADRTVALNDGAAVYTPEAKVEVTSATDGTAVAVDKTGAVTGIVIGTEFTVAAKESDDAYATTGQKFVALAAAETGLGGNDIGIYKTYEDVTNPPLSNVVVEADGNITLAAADTCTVVAANGKDVSILGNAYTTGAASTFTATKGLTDAADSVVLETGTVTFGDGDKVATANDLTVENVSGNTSTETVTVTHANVVTSTADSADAKFNVTIGAASKGTVARAATIDGKVYTNETSGTVSKLSVVHANSGDATTATLQEGAVILAEDAQKLVAGDATVTRATDGNSKKVVVAIVADECVVKSVESGTGCDVLLAGASRNQATVGGKVYKNATDATATATLAVAAATVADATVTTVTLTAGTVSMDEADAALVLGNATITNKAAGKAVTVNDTNGITALANGGSYEVEIKKGNTNTIKIGAQTYTNASNDNAANIAVSADAEGKQTVSLSSGALTIDKDAEVVATDGAVIKNTSTAAKTIVVSADGTVTSVQAEATFTVKVDDVTRTYTMNAGTTELTMTSGTRTDKYAHTTDVSGVIVNADGSVTLDDGIAATLNYGGDDEVAIEADATTTPFTVDLDGTVSGLVSGAKYTVTSGTVVRTYETVDGDGDAKALAVYGNAAGRVGVYAFNDEAKLAAATVEADGNVYTSEGEKSPQEIVLTLKPANAATTSGTGTPQYYKLTANGKVELDSGSGHTIPTNCIAYFEVTTTGTEVEVKFVGNSSDATQAPKTYLGPIKIDAAAVETITDDEAGPRNITQIKVAGLSEAETDDSDITVTNLYHGATAYGTNVVVEGLAYAVLGTANTIALPASLTTGEANALYYAITPVTAKDPGPEVAYQIASSGVALGALDNNTAYLKVTATDANTYEVTYGAKGSPVVGGTEVPLALSDASWQGIVLNAANVPAAVTSIVVDATEHGGYTVTNLKHGMSVSSSDGTAFTTEFTGGYYYEFKAGSLGTDTNKLALANNDATTTYYEVTFETHSPDDGAVVVNIAGGATGKDADWQASHNYFVVTKTNTTASLSGSVAIDYVANGYTNNGKYSLKNMTKEGKTKLPIAVDALSITTVDTIAFSSGMASYVNNVVLTLTDDQAGITVTDGGTTVTKDTSTSVVSLATPIAYAYENGIVIDASTITPGASETVLYVTLTPDETTRVQKLGTSTNPGSNTYGHYTVSRDADGGLEVKYELSDGDTNIFTAHTVTGKTEIQLGGSESTITDVVLTNADDVADNSKLTGAPATLASVTVNSADAMATKKTDGSLVYAETSVFAYEKADGSAYVTTGALSFANIESSGAEDTGKTTRTYYYVVTSADSGTGTGVTWYKIAKASTTPPASTVNYFKAVYTNATGAIVMSYVPAESGTIITAATMNKVGLVKVDGSTVDTETATTAAITRKITLPDNVGVNVVDLPKEVKTVDMNGMGSTSTYAYKPTYDITTTIALGKTKGEAWYRLEVTTPGTNENYGVNTCRLVSSTEPTETQLEQYNYVKVETATQPANRVTVQYIPATGADASGKAYAINLDGQKITLDPTGAASDVGIILTGVTDAVDEVTTYDNVTYVVKNLTKEQSVVPAAGTGTAWSPADVTAYAESYAVTYAVGTGAKAPTITAIAAGADGHIDLKKASDGVVVGTTKFYYEVTKSAARYDDPNQGENGVVTYTVTQVKDEPGSGNYITVSYGSATGISVSYSGDDISGIGEKIAIDATGAADTVTAIDLKNSNTQINYALTNVAAGVSVENTGTNDIYAQLATVDLTGQTLVLDTTAEVYWTISASGALTRTTTKPTDGETNYFSVEKTDTKYTVAYHQAENGTAYDLRKATLAVNAAGIPASYPYTLDLSNGSDTLQGYTVTGAPAGVSMTNGGTKDTSISYTSTFSAWPTAPATGNSVTYTYFVPKLDSAGEPVKELKTSSTAVTVAPESDTKKQKGYNKVVITAETVTTGTGANAKTTTTYSMVLDGVKQGEKDVTDTATNIEIIPLPDSVAILNANVVDTTSPTPVAVANLTFTNLTTGDLVINAQGGQTFSGAGTIKIDNNDGTSPQTFVQSGTDPIVVKMNGTVAEAYSGTFVLAEGESIAPSTAATGAEIGQVTLGTTEATTATVRVTFAEGKVSSITGLGDNTDEKVTVTLGNGYTVSYKFENGIVTKVENNGVTDTTTYAGADASTVATLDITKLNYQATVPKVENAIPLKGFAWETGDYYLPYSGTAASVAVTEDTGAKVSTGTYIHAKVTMDGTTRVLALEAVNGTALGTVNVNRDFAGTITVDTLNGPAVAYTKDVVATGDGFTDKFTVNFTNATAGSKFSYLNGTDKVTTGSLALGATITMTKWTDTDSDGVIDGGETADAIYTAAAADTVLVFDGGKITDGTVKMVAGSCTLLASGNETVAVGTTGDVKVTFEDGTVKSITGFSKTDDNTAAITLKTYTKDAEGNDVLSTTTTYTAKSDTEIYKAVVDAVTGATTTETLTIAEKDADILAPTGSITTSLVTQLDMNPTIVPPATSASSTGYIEVGLTIDNTAVVNPTTPTPSPRTLDKTADAGKYFVKVTVTNDDTGVNKVEMVPMVYKDGNLTTTGVNASEIKVTFDAIKGGSATAITYDRSTVDFGSVAFTNIAADSVFTGLKNGDTVTTAALPTKGTSAVTINSTKYTALDNNATFKIYAPSANSTYIVNGKVVVKDKAVTSIDATDTTKRWTVTYTAGTADGSKNGVVATYTNGVAAIADLDDGEKVEVYNAKTTKTTTYERKGNYIYRTAEDGTVTGGAYTDATQDIVGWTYGDNLSTVTTAQFAWADTATKNAEGYFLLSGTTPTATVADQATAVSINYTNYGQKYVHATVTPGGVLTLWAVTVNNNGTLAEAALDGQAVTVSGIGGKTISYTRAGEKSITLDGVGKNSSISTLVAGDSVMTATLAKDDTVTINGKGYTAAAAGTTMSFSGGNVTGGTFLLSGTGATATMTTTRTDNDGNVYTYLITYNRDSALATADQNIAVTVANGVVTGVTGLGASTKKNGESVTIVTSYTDKYGTVHNADSTTTYSAVLSSETGKAGQILVTRSVDGTTSTHTFANTSQNILDSSAVWTTDNYSTKLDFNWKKTGYFLASDAAKKGTFTAKVASQTYDPEDSTTWIDYNDEGDIYLEVVATRASDTSPSVISAMRLVKVGSKGALTEYTTGTIGDVTIDASGADVGGIELPAHTNKIAITGAVTKAVFSGLNAADTLAGTGTVTMNGTKYVANGAYAMNGAGELTTGTFTITDKATGSAVPAHDGDNVINIGTVLLPSNKYGAVEKSLVYTAGSDVAEANKGVEVEFTDGQITSVTGLNAGEQVVLTQVKGTAQDTGVVTTITKDVDNVVTRSMAIPGVSTPLTMTRTDDTAGTQDVLDMKANGGFKVTNVFDYGATTAGRVGLFKATATAGRTVTIAAQTADGTETFGADATYVMVETAPISSGNVTLNSLRVLSFDGTSTGTLSPAKTSTVKTVNVTAPTGGNLTLANGAEVIFTEYKYDEDTKTYVENTAEGATETSRSYNIAVQGAAAGKSYSGFGEKDTVTGPLVSGDTITVNSKTLTLAGNNTISIRGDGKAINGLFALGSGIESAAAVTADDAAQFTARVTGATAAQVTFTGGEVTGIKNVSANDTVQIVSTNTKTGAVSTTIYKAEAITGDDNNLKITRTTTADGLTSVVTRTALKGTDIIADDWSTPTATLTSRFTWASADGSGYFLTEATDASKKLGEITVEAQSTPVTTEVGKYYLQVKLSGNGEVSGLELHKIKADGTPDSDVMSQVTEGTIHVTAPTTALKLDATGTSVANVVFKITGAATKSEVKLKAKDTLTTASLSAGDYVTVNAAGDTTKKIVAGGTGTLEFAGTGAGAATYAAQLKNGAVQFTKDSTALAIDTTAGSFTVEAPTGTETPIVTVKNGAVTQIAGNTASTVTVTDAGGNIAEYTKAGMAVNFKTLVPNKDITTAALSAGAAITGGGMTGFKTAANGALTLHTLNAGQLQVYEGAIQFDSDAAAAQKVTRVYVTGAKTAETSDDLTATYTAAKGNNSAVTVTVAQGVVTAIQGLLAGDSLNYNGYTYTAKSATVIEKLKDGDSADKAVTAYLSKVGADILSASYTVVDADTDITGNETFEGQFSWAEVKGRSTGYFKITEGKNANTATIAEQTTKSSPTAAKNKTVKYVKANTSTASEGSVTPQILTIGAIQVTNTNGVTTVSETNAAKILTAGTKITVNAPTAKVGDIVPALSYTKAYADKYNVVINKAASGSAFAGLTSGDKVTTAAFAAPVSKTTAGVETVTYEGVTMTDGTGTETITYMAGAKGALEFVGTGTSAELAADATNKAALVKGTIVLDADDTAYGGGVNKTAVLAGSADGTAANITLSLSAADAANSVGDWKYDPDADANTRPDDQVVVTVDKGVVKSITGLKSKGMALTVTPEGGTAVTYKVLYTEPNYTWKADGTRTALGTYTAMVERTQGETKTYGSFVVGKSFADVVNKKGEITNYSAAVDTPTNTDKLWADTGKATQVVYAEIDTVTGTANFAQAATDPIKGATAERGKRYLAMTVKTTNGVTTIQKVEVAEVGATGAPVVYKNRPVNGNVVINGANGSGFAKINYAIPSTTPVTITNAAIGSVITGMKAGDLVTTADQTDYALAKGTVLLYRTVDTDTDGSADKTVETKVTYALKAKGDSAKIDVKDGAISKLTGLETNGESLTVVETTEKGDVTTVYAVKKMDNVLYVTKTVTAADGTEKLYRTTVPSDAASYDWIADSKEYFKTPYSADVVTNFDWTLAKKNTGYFVVDTKNAATVKAQTKATTIKSTDANTYIAVKISDDYVLDEIKSVKMDATTGEMVDATSKFAGTINVTAPTKHSLTFDRSKVDTTTTIADTATVAITGALKGSAITNLALGDTVTTAKLSKNVFKNNTWVGADYITVAMADDTADTDAGSSANFKAAANGTLGFKVQNVDNAPHLTLTGGTIELASGQEQQGRGFAYVGDRMITMKGGDITVAASTNKNGVTSYTVSDLKEGEVFTVESFGSGASVKKFMRSGNNLFCEITTGSGTTTAVYELKTGTSVKSSILDLAETAGASATKKNPWVAYTEANATFKETENGLELTSTAKNAAVTVDMKLLDNRIKADNNLYKTDDNIYARETAMAISHGTYGTNSAYTFVIDKYLANPAKFNGAASVINNVNRLSAADNTIDLQQAIGTWAGATYTATNNIAQTIKMTTGKWANGSDQADTIIGATSGKDTIAAGMGNDTITGGKATDTFWFYFADDDTTTKNQNTLNSFGNGADKLVINSDTDYSVKLVSGVSGKTKTADVLIWNDTDGDGEYGSTEQGVTLKNMGNKKAVAINGVDYYFGSATTSKAETFTYADDARYYANNALNSGTKVNTLAISKTDNKKATAKTLGDAIEVDLNAKIGDTDTLQYYGIRAVDASKSGNKVVLTASNVEEAKNSVLKGGTYQSTLVGGIGNDSLYGGSGADTFWFNAVEGQDTVSNYASGKDAVVLKDKAIAFSADTATAGGVILSASGNDVIITDADDGSNTVTLSKAVNAAKAVTIITDTVEKTALSYYVGATTGKKANAFTATLDKDMAFEKDAEGKVTTTLSMKSYYVGSNSKTDDALKLSSGKTVVTGAKLNMNDISSHLSSIDVIDTSGLAKNSSIELIGRESGTYTLKGSNNVTENFNLSALKDEKTAGVANSVTVTNLAVADVITLGEGITATKTSGPSSKNTYFTLADSSGNSYGTLTVTGVAASKFTASSYTGTIKRS